MQDFEEAQVWPLTSPTTCYTGAVAVVDASDGSAQWATERHSCQLHSLIVDKDDDDDDDDNCNINNNNITEPLFSWNSLTAPESNRKDESTIAVGYSVCRDWEAVALLDLSNLPPDSTTTATNASATVANTGQSEDPHELTPQPLIRRDSEGSIKTATSNAATLNTSSGLTQSQHSQSLSQSQQSQHSQSQSQQSQSQSQSQLSQSQLTSQRGTHRHQLSNDNFPSMDSLSMAAITEQSETHHQLQQPNQQPNQQHQAQLILRRRTNDAVTSTGSTGDATATAATATTSTSTSTTTEYAVKLDFRPLAPLVCQFPVATTYKDALSSDCDNDDDDDDDDENNNNNNSSNSNDSIVTGVFLGSADNHRLYWFVPSDANNAALESIDLQNVVGRKDGDNEDQAVAAPAFVFESSVTALAFCAGGSGSVPTTKTAPEENDGNLDHSKDDENDDHCLVVACQDGSIRLINFWYAQGIFTRVQHTTIVIDGPLVCLHVRYLPPPPPLNGNMHSSEQRRRRRRRRHVVVGSLCGYVAELYETASADGLSVSSSASASSLSLWDGPYMVAEGLWSQKLKSEDSVLAVHAYNDNVVLGTLSGRCLLYQKFGDTAYELVWECRLPYSVHAVCHVPAAAVPDGAPAEPGSTKTVQPLVPQPALLVTTRRSVHLLTPKRPRYSASLAKERLEKLLQQYTPVPAPVLLVQDQEQEQDVEQEQEQQEPDAKDPAKDNNDDDDVSKLDEIPVPASTSTPPVESSDDIVTATVTDVAVATDTATDISTATATAADELPTSSSSSSSSSSPPPPPSASVLVDQSSSQTKLE